MGPSTYHCPRVSNLLSYDPWTSPGNSSNMTTRVRCGVSLSSESDKTDTDVTSMAAQASKMVDYVIYVHAKEG